jgi:hypothetical protein
LAGTLNDRADQGSLETRAKWTWAAAWRFDQSDEVPVIGGAGLSATELLRADTTILNARDRQAQRGAWASAKNEGRLSIGLQRLNPRSMTNATPVT